MTVRLLSELFRSEGLKTVFLPENHHLSLSEANRLQRNHFTLQTTGSPHTSYDTHTGRNLNTLLYRHNTTEINLRIFLQLCVR